jgi:hypothetical protein
MSLGRLAVNVWPPYIGLSDRFPGAPGEIAQGEPHDDVNYARGMIQWRTENGQVVGSAQIYAPTGIWSHVVFFSGPHHIHPLMGSNPFDQPVVFDRPGVIELNPIQNHDYLPRDAV